MLEETYSGTPPRSGKRRDRVIAIQVAPGADLPPLEREAVHTAVREQGPKPGGLIEVLHAVQARLGCVPPRTVPLIAYGLNLTRAEVHGVISFYHDFREQPPGQRVVKLCRAEACQAVGARALETHLREQLGIDLHTTTPDGRVTLEPVYCLGNCALGPSVMIDGRLHGRVTPQGLERLLGQAP
ncbi:formate dehydrogenase subunit gamma [Polycyclovorans algicola]|uniref:formate dehydrogenase subunit gamma n=1 Tax=Polycyclovorans algicola TaxID=616992 RepID=UPI0009FDCB0F|nr:formate dehydrogenase subunit gamma [Polycyclovorans algicola]